MKQVFVIRVLDGRKGRFLTSDKERSVLTNNIKQANQYDLYEDAEAMVEMLPEVDGFAEEMGKDLVADDAVYSIVKIYTK